MSVQGNKVWKTIANKNLKRSSLAKCKRETPTQRKKRSEHQSTEEQNLEQEEYVDVADDEWKPSRPLKSCYIKFSFDYLLVNVHLLMTAISNFVRSDGGCRCDGYVELWEEKIFSSDLQRKLLLVCSECKRSHIFCTSPTNNDGFDELNTR